MTAAAAQLTSAGTRFRPWPGTPAGWSCLLVLLVTTFVRVVTLPADAVVAPLAVAPGIVGAWLASTLLALAALRAWTRLLGEPPSFPVRVVQLAVAIVPAALVLTLFLGGLGLRESIPPALPLIALSVLGEAVAGWWVVDGLARDWATARLARDRLAEALGQASALNRLFVQAERASFAADTRAVVEQVEGPLRGLLLAAPRLSPAALGESIDELIATVMRPLAHLVHPVAVRAGLFPAVQALGPGFEIVAPAELLEADGAGTLLDDDVRLQLYRWLRRLEPDRRDGVVTIAAARSGDGASVAFMPSGSGPLPPLDPPQRIAGLVVRAGATPDDPVTLIAPVRGVRAAPEPDAAWPEAAVRPRRATWRLLATPMEVNVAFVALVSAATAPVRFFPAVIPLEPLPVLALAVSVGAPVIAALAVRWLRPPVAGVRAVAFTVGSWTVVGLVAGVSTVAALAIAPSLGSDAGPLSQMIRGLVRHLPTGILYQLAVGAARTAEADGIALRAALEEAHRLRAAVMEQVERMERDVSEALHRGVQGRLAAAAVLARLGRTDEAIAELRVIADERLPAIVARLASASLEAEPGATDPTAETALGVIVDDRVDWAALGRRHPDLAPAFRRVADECSVNALRHGRAEHAILTLLEEGGRLGLRFDDDGTAPVGPRGSGLGSRLFDEVCDRFGGEWSLGPRPDGEPGTSFVLLVGPRPG